MEVEKRHKTAKTYVTCTSCHGGILRKSHIGTDTNPVVQRFLESERLANVDELAYLDERDREQPTRLVMSVNITLESHPIYIEYAKCTAND